MSTTTDRIGLFKYDTSNSTDLASAFNINTALNNNWDKLDYCVTTSTKGADIGGLDQPVYVNSAGQIATCNAYDTISGGLTAEVSLSENGYIKFSNKFCIAWLRYTSETGVSLTSKTHTLPITFTTVYNVIGNTYKPPQAVEMRYFTASDWTKSTVTYAVTYNIMVIVLGKKN